MNLLKLTPFVIISVISAFFMGYASTEIATSFDLFFDFKAFLTIIIILSLSILFFTFSYSLTNMFLKSLPMRVGYIILHILAFMLGITVISTAILNTPYILLILTILFTIGLIISTLNVRNSYNNLIVPSFSSTFSSSGRGMLIFLSISIALSFYLLNNTDEKQTELQHAFTGFVATQTATIFQDQIQNNLDTVIENQQGQINTILQDTLKTATQKLMPEMTDEKKSSLESLDSREIEIMLKSSEISIEGLSNEDLAQIVESQLSDNATPKNLKPALTINLDEIQNTAMGSVSEAMLNIDLHQMMIEQLNALTEPYKKYISSFFAIIMFLTINTIITITMLFAPLIGALFAWILKSLGYIHEEKTMVEVTRYFV